MQHKNSKLGTRIDEWESSQTGLPEGSETIWAELEQVLELKTSTKNQLIYAQLQCREPKQVRKISF